MSIHAMLAEAKSRTLTGQESEKRYDNVKYIRWYQTSKPPGKAIVVTTSGTHEVSIIEVDVQSSGRLNIMFKLMSDKDGEYTYIRDKNYKTFRLVYDWITSTGTIEEE